MLYDCSSNNIRFKKSNKGTAASIAYPTWSFSHFVKRKHAIKIYLKQKIGPIVIYAMKKLSKCKLSQKGNALKRLNRMSI